MSQKQDDMMLVRAVRAAVARNHLDTSELQITSNRGIIELMGKVKTPRGYAGEFNPRKEFQVLQTQVRAVRGVKDVYAPRVTVID